MEYGLWNLSGSFWAGNTPCTSSERTLYSSINAGGTIATSFQGCSGLETTVPFADVTSAQPCRAALRGQPEFVAMKPATSEAVPILQAGSTSANVEVLPVHVELLTELSGQDSCNSNTMTMSTNAQLSETISDQLQKKVKSKSSNQKRGAGLKPEVTLPGFNQQYNPMYSMMFGRSSLKRTDVSSGSEEEEEAEEGEDDDDNINNVDAYSDESSPAIGSNSPHRSRSGYECGQCDLVADTRPALKKHISMCHPGPATTDSSTLLKVPSSCPMPSCNFSCATREMLEAHVARHVADGFQRHSANKKRSNAISLQRVRYEKEEYRCQICSYTCTTEKAFYKHLKQHTLGLSVTSVKISCVICGKDRPSEVEMNKHMRKHRESRYFCCDVCIFKTVQLKKLIQHRRMHTGEKPHRCPHCAYRSARRDNLRSHVRRVHKRDNIYCDTFSPRGLLVSQPPSPSDPQQ